jgi:hypothetical protein
MFDRLRAMLVQEVPEELSVCEFDCPVTRCTVSDWAECSLRNQPSLHGLGVARYRKWTVGTESIAVPGIPGKALV